MKRFPDLLLNPEDDINNIFVCYWLSEMNICRNKKIDYSYLDDVEIISRIKNAINSIHIFLPFLVHSATIPSSTRLIQKEKSFVLPLCNGKSFAKLSFVIIVMWTLLILLILILINKYIIISSKCYSIASSLEVLRKWSLPSVFFTPHPLPSARPIRSKRKRACEMLSMLQNTRQSNHQRLCGRRLSDCCLFHW